MANRTVTVFKSMRRGANFGTGAVRSFNWTYTPGSGAEDQNVTGVTFDGKYLIFCTDEPNPALGTSARFVVIHPRSGAIIRVLNAGVTADGGLRDICWDGKYILGLDYFANDAVPTCAVSVYNRKTGTKIRPLVTGLSTDYWSITFDGKYILLLIRPSGGSPQCYMDVMHRRSGKIITRKIMLNILDPNVGGIHPGIGWDGKYVLDKSDPSDPFGAGIVAMRYQAHHRRYPDGGAGVLANVLNNGTTPARAGEGRSITFDGKYLYDFTQV